MTSQGLLTLEEGNVEARLVGHPQGADSQGEESRELVEVSLGLVGEG